MDDLRILDSTRTGIGGGMRGLEVCRSKSYVIKSDSVDSRPYRRASRENTGLENPLTDLLSSKITDYYFLIHLSLHPPPSFPSHSFIIIRLSPPSSSSLLFRGMAARYHSFEVYFICNAKEKLIVLIFFFFFRYSASKLSFIVISIQSIFAEFFSFKYFNSRLENSGQIVNTTIYEKKMRRKSREN